MIRWSMEGTSGHRSVIRPIPAYSRTAVMPATAAALSGNGRERAIRVPSGGCEPEPKMLVFIVEELERTCHGAAPAFSSGPDAALRSGNSGRVTDPVPQR